MKVLGIYLLGILFSLQLAAREVNVRLWISGGMQGLVMGSRECPGWLSVARQLEQDDPDGCWLHLGAPPLPDYALRIPGLKFPDFIIPAEEDFRLQGLPALIDPFVPYTLFNIDVLPQFPEIPLSFPAKGEWKQADGVGIYAFGLISANAPLRIPADRLRPLQVTDPLKSLRNYLTDNSLSASVFPVLVLPQDADGPEWSNRFPEIPVLVLPPGAQSKVIEVQDGKQLRVQAAKFGRSLIRVQIYWDTVTKTFRDPTAEVVWVNGPDLQGVELPSRLVSRLHPLREVPHVDLGQALLANADAVLLPKIKTLRVESKLPDAIRLNAVPEDDAWLRVKIPAPVWNQWRITPDTVVYERDRLGEELRVLVPATLAAGRGDWHAVIRRDLMEKDFESEWMSFTSRDMILPLETTP